MNNIFRKLEDKIYDRTEFYPRWVLQRWWWDNQAEKVRVRVLGPRMFKQWYETSSQLSLVLGNTLVHFSSHAIGHPLQYSYGEWKGLLHSKGVALLRYYEDDEDDPEIAAAAQEALHWVADHLPNLWD